MSNADVPKETGARGVPEDAMSKTNGRSDEDTLKQRTVGEEGTTRTGQDADGSRPARRICLTGPHGGGNAQQALMAGGARVKGSDATPSDKRRQN